jgi:RNA polymerase sigma-70 factor (ECF subfamily)
MQQVAQGNGAALAQLYDRYANLVYSFAMHMVGEPEAAREVVGQVFALVWERGRSVDLSQEDFASWLLGQAHHIGVAELRCRRAESPRGGEYTAPNGPHYDIQTVRPDLDLTSPWDERMAQQRHEVRRALETLSREQRRTVELAYFQGYTQDEIARLTGEPVATVASQLRLSLLRLQAMTERDVMRVER